MRNDRRESNRSSLYSPPSTMLSCPMQRSGLSSICARGSLLATRTRRDMQQPTLSSVRSASSRSHNSGHRNCTPSHGALAVMDGIFKRQLLLPCALAIRARICVRCRKTAALLFSVSPRNARTFSGFGLPLWERSFRFCCWALDFATGARIPDAIPYPHAL